MSEISASGDDSLGLTTIYSEVYNGGILVVDSISDMTQNWTLFCNSSDTCIILCGSSSACTNLSGQCVGQCFVNCTYNATFVTASNNHSSGDTECSTRLQGNVNVIPSSAPTKYVYNDTGSMQEASKANISTDLTIEWSTESPSGESAYKLGINRNILLAIIITSGVTVLICVCSLFFYCHKRQKGEKQRKLVQMKLLLAKSLAALSKIKVQSGDDQHENMMQNNNKNDDHTTRFGSIDLQKSGNTGEGNQNDKSGDPDDEGLTQVGHIVRDDDSEVMDSVSEGELQNVTSQ